MFKVKLLQSGPISTAHVVDETTGKLWHGVSENLEEAIAKAVNAMYKERLLKHPAVDLLEEVATTADTDKILEKVSKYLASLEKK